MAVDMFLKIDGIKGESTVKGHEGEINVLSFSWGAMGGGGTGQATLQDFSIVKALDGATPKLLTLACLGQATNEATLTVSKSSSKGIVDYFKVKLSSILVSSYQTGGSETGDPAESISFSFQSIVMSVREQRFDGSFDDWVDSTCHANGGLA